MTKIGGVKSGEKHTKNGPYSVFDDHPQNGPNKGIDNVINGYGTGYGAMFDQIPVWLCVWAPNIGGID